MYLDEPLKTETDEILLKVMWENLTMPIRAYLCQDH